MPPFDISNVGLQVSHADVLQQLSTSGSFKKIYNGRRSKGSKRSHNLIWASSPLTPWENETNLNQKRKMSMKAFIRNAKNSKNNIKEPRKKNKKDLRKSVGLEANSAKTTDYKTKEFSNSFRHHSDVGEHMREYRKSKNMTTTKHRDSSYRGIYGTEDIDKAYDSLDIPNLAKRKGCQLSSECNGVGAASVSDESIDDDNHDLLPNRSARNKAGSVDGTLPGGREKLPTLNVYALQSTSDSGQLFLSTSATRRNLPQTEKHPKSTAAKPKINRLSLSTKRPQTMVLLPQENRMVEFSLPQGCLVIDKNIQDIQTNQNVVGLGEITEHVSKIETQSSKNGSCCFSTPSSAQKHDFSESQDDALQLDENTNFSCQSLVLSSTASSYLGSSCSNNSNLTRMEREKLSTHIKNLHPFSRNGRRVHDVQKKTEHLSANMHAKNVSDDAKQPLSLKTYQKLSHKLSMRRFIGELYISPKEKSILESDELCFLEGKQLQKCSSSVVLTLPPIKSKNLKVVPKLKKETETHLQIDTAKAIKRPDEVPKSKRIIKPIQHIVTLEKQKVTKPTKFRVAAKCNSFSKQPVSVRGFAL